MYIFYKIYLQFLPVNPPRQILIKESNFSWTLVFSSTILRYHTQPYTIQQ